MIEQLKELRISIDAISNLVKKLKPLGPNENPLMHGTHLITFEVYEANKSLLLAKAWIGKTLGELGQPTPYQKDGDRHSVEDIEPIDASCVITEDNIKFGGKPVVNWKELNHIERVDILREFIQTRIDVVCNLDFYGGLWDNISDNITKDQTVEVDDKLCKQASNSKKLCSYVFQHLTEARLHLGFELGRIREQK